MKKKYFTYFLLILFNTITAQYTAIPDAAFEQELINQGIDTDSTVNGHVLTSDINTVTSLTISDNNNIINLIGIQDFMTLEYLEVSYCGSFNNLYINNNSNLKTLVCLRNNSLYNIDLSNNIALEEIGFEGLFLNQLNLANNVNLKYATIAGCGLENLNIDNNINLIYLNCSYNFLTTLNISNNVLLEILWFDNNNISMINVSQNTALKQLVFRNNSISNIDVNNNFLLENLITDNNPIQTYNLFNNINLKQFSCKSNQLTTLNLSNNPLLNIFRCDNNSNLTTLYINNGANSLLNGQYDIGSSPPVYRNRFNATNNPNLHCIFVDDVANCTANWLGIDTTSHFVATQAECDALSNEEFSSNEISVYPNPVKDILHINNQSETIEEIVVYDLLGKKVVEQKTNNNQINLSELTSGFYVVKIKTENGFQTQKIVKQ